MYYVYYGYVSPDNYDTSDGPNFVIKEFSTVDEVLSFKKEFDEELYEDCFHVTFRVFHGAERELKPKQVVTEYELK